MVLRLAEHLDIPLRDQNLLLVAAGYAPVFPERSLDDPVLSAARKAVDLVLTGHEPYPALAIDRHWNMIAANAALPRLLTDIDASLLSPPVNVLRLSLHPRGLAPRILNLAEWRVHLFIRLRRQIDLSADPVLVDLMTELSGYPQPKGRGIAKEEYGGVIVPLKLQVGGHSLSLISTTTLFGTPLDISLSELALETFFPADAQTGDFLRELATSTPARGGRS